MKSVRTLGVVLVLGFLSFCFFQSGASLILRRLRTGGDAHGIVLALSREEREAIASVRHVARSKDKTRVGEVLKHLDSESERVRAAAALAVGRLAAHEGKDKLQKLRDSRKEDGIAAKIALARLSAESSGSDATAKVRDFLSTLGMSTRQLNSWVGAEDPENAGVTFYTLILREIADMVAEANRRGTDISDIEREINFETDYPSALKVSLSKMSQSKQITFLIQNIRTLQPTWERSQDAQALADEGTTAVPAIIDALKEIHDEINRNGFTRTRGAAGRLIDAMGCIGDPRALPILQAYVNQPGTLPYPDIPKGTSDRFTQEYAKFAIRNIKEKKEYCVAPDY